MTDTTYDTVNDHYSRLARETTSVHEANSEKVALSFGYSVEELSTIPDGANLGVSCGNPTALAALKEGETVVDLGSGAGFDVFLAARKVGSSGLAVGVDMSKDMLSRARANAEKSNITNVKFVESGITKIDLPSTTADCIISNCVINLVPANEKNLVFEEIFRVLKPGGRVAVSDILAKKQIPNDLLSNMSLYVGCISGASLMNEYSAYLKNAGFQGILIVDKNNDLNVYKENDLLLDVEGKKDSEAKAAKSSCCGSSNTDSAGAASFCGVRLPANSGAAKDIDFNEWVGSFNIYAVKP